LKNGSKDGCAGGKFCRHGENASTRCRAENDVDFGKRAELLTPVESAILRWEITEHAAHHVGWGLRSNLHCQVWMRTDKLEGLYVAGSAAGDFFANDYPTICPGIGHGRCVTFGRIAGMYAAGKNIDDIPSIEI
jgi:succinate dehydrogenase/fumarate reductase flavoprotein subunit